VACLLTAFGFAKFLGYDVGTAAGLLAGAFSESTVIGTAGEAIQRLAIPDADKTALVNNIPVAYAVTYLIGTASLVWFLPTIGPKLMRINLREEGARMQAAIAGAAHQALGVVSGARAFDIRAFRVTNPDLVNKTVAQLEALPPDARVFIVRVRRGGEIIESTPDTVIRKDDVVAVTARQAACAAGDWIGLEVDDRYLLDIPIETLDVVVTNRSLVGKSMADLARLPSARGSFPPRHKRAGQEIPSSEITLRRPGDALSLIGTQVEAERAPRKWICRSRHHVDGHGVRRNRDRARWVCGPLPVTVAGITLPPAAAPRHKGWCSVGCGRRIRWEDPGAGDLIFDTVGLHLHRCRRPERGPSFVAGLQKSGISPSSWASCPSCCLTPDPLRPLRAEDGP
jgi:putative transport protein